MARNPVVYSTAFIEGTGGTPNRSFEVPTGYVAVITDVTLWTEIGGEDISIQISGPGADYAIIFAFLSAAGVSASDQWRGRVVAGPGYTIEVNEGGLAENSAWYVGGYLLTINP